MLIAQLTDIHVRPQRVLYQDVVDSNRMLLNAIDHLHSLDRRPDLVVITGDIVDKGHPDEYDNALELLKRLTIPYLVLPGNHDDRQAFRSAFSHHSYLPKFGPLHFCVDEHPIRIVGLDTTVPDLHHGALNDFGLSWLEKTLSQDKAKPTLILMHHPPFRTGIPYLDKYRCMNANSIETILRSFTNIEAILCGHVHRLIVRRWAGTVVIASPSTVTEIALQLNPKSKPQSFLGPRGCMLHLWNPEDGLVSHLSHIEKQDGPYPFF